MVVVMWAFFAVMGVEQGLLFTEPLICNKCVTNDSLNSTMGHEIPANIGVGIRKERGGGRRLLCVPSEGQPGLCLCVWEELVLGSILYAYSVYFFNNLNPFIL